MFVKISPKKIPKKDTIKGPKPLTMEAYKDFLDKENSAIDPVTLRPIDARDGYCLASTYNAMDNSLPILSTDL